MEIIKQELKPVRPDPQPLLTYEQVNVLTSFQRLWAQIAVWTRAFFLSSLYNLQYAAELSKGLYYMPMVFRPIFSFFLTRGGKYLLFSQDKGGDENFNIYAVYTQEAPAVGRGNPVNKSLNPLKRGGREYYCFS